jgi:carboxymethylenebutenolidase
VLLLAGEGGEPLSPSDLAMVQTRLRSAGKTVESVAYEGTHRGFFNNPDASYDATAAEDAWRRTIDWLERYLA